MKILKSSFLLVSLLLFFGCLGEDPASIDTSKDDSSEESSEEESSSSESSSEEASSSSVTPSSDDDSSSSTDDSSSSQENSSEETSSEASTTDESSSATDESSAVAESSEATVTVDIDTEGSESPTGDGVFENWEDGNAQNTLSEDVALENSIDLAEAGGYWYAYADDSGSVVTTVTGDNIPAGDADMPDAIIDNALHVILDGSASTEEYPVSGLGVNLMYGTEDDDEANPRLVDLTGLSAVKIRAKGSDHKIVVGFAAAEMPDWGAYDFEFKLTSEWKIYEIPVDEFMGSANSLLYGHEVGEQITDLVKFSFAPAGAGKKEAVQLSIDYVQFVGVSAADVPYVELP